MSLIDKAVHCQSTQHFLPASYINSLYLLCLAFMQSHHVFSQKLSDFTKVGNLVLVKSSEILSEAQATTGGTSASLYNTRYTNYCYPRDHGYATRAFIALGDYVRALNALRFILTCPLSEENSYYQRYSLQGQNASYKPPQIDGNAQTLLSVARYCKKVNRTDCHIFAPKIIKIIDGILAHKHTFHHGSLIYSLNGILEYTPFEKGFELYTNAVCYRALLDIAAYPELIGHTRAKKLQSEAESIQKGILYYLYNTTEKTFYSCMRTEPDVSMVPLANLKSFLALADFEVVKNTDKRLTLSLEYHLNGTRNSDLKAYNRYHSLMNRHNFGNGPWPLVMLRLAHYYLWTQQQEEAMKCLSWVLNAAKNNLDYPLLLPEHIATKEAFLKEYLLFKKLNEIAERPAKEKEYRQILASKTMRDLKLAYAVNPLVWSHAQFILTWTDIKADTPSHNY